MMLQVVLGAEKRKERQAPRGKMPAVGVDSGGTGNLTRACGARDGEPVVAHEQGVRPKVACTVGLVVQYRAK